MSDTDSFIDEVSEEVRRDRLFKLMKKYGWIAIVLVLVLVGGAAFNEYRKASEQAAAQALGDEIIVALQTEDDDARASALQALVAQGEASAIVGLLTAVEDVNSGSQDAAVAGLLAITQDQNLPTAYRQVAELKLLMLLGDDLPTPERMSRLQTLAAPGAPFRLLAEEQMAMAEISANDSENALIRLFAILEDGEVTAGLRRRVSQLIVALGGDLQPA